MAMLMLDAWCIHDHVGHVRICSVSASRAQVSLCDMIDVMTSSLVDWGKTGLQDVQQMIDSWELTCSQSYISSVWLSLNPCSPKLLKRLKPMCC